MHDKLQGSDGAVVVPVPGMDRKLHNAIAARYQESGAQRFGISPALFQQHVANVVERYGAGCDDSEKIALVGLLRIEELVLARACSAGSDAAWAEFVARFRGDLHRAASQVARDETAGRDLADELYAELYGLPNQDGRRVSKFDYYMGRGSLAGWLRTVLAQRHVDRCRSRARQVSLDEQLDSGISFAAKQEDPAIVPDGRVAQAVGETLAALVSEERFLLASYYLDGQTLAAIGRRLGVGESTISRRLKRLTAMVRKRVRKRMIADGMEARRCDELLEELDVRDLPVDVGRNLRQEEKIQTF